MIIGVGIDLIEVARVAKVCETNTHFVERVFAKSEVEYSARNKKSPYQHLAACWAAKEAFYKATNIKCNFRDVVVNHFDTGQPFLVFGESARAGIEKFLRESPGSEHRINECRNDGDSDPDVIEDGSRNRELRTHLSISHIKDYATAMVVVESLLD